MAGLESTGIHLRLLLGLDRRRLAAAVRQPTLAGTIAVVLPSALLLSGLVAIGAVGEPDAGDALAGMTLGMLVSGPLSFLAYGALFRGADDGFLRQLGVDPRALFLERCLRLGILALLTVAAVAVPFATADRPLARPLGIAVVAATVAVGIGAFVFGWAAYATAAGRDGWLGAGIRQFDPDLAKAAALVYAPLAPFLLGVGGATLAGSGRVPPPIAGVIGLAVAVLGVLAGAVLFERAAPRLVPLAREMSHVPLPEGEGATFRLGRGLSALLPRRASAVWVRDATVAGRRFTWAARVSWPIAIASFIALARWGGVPGTRLWVLTTVGIGLLLQSLAVVAVGGLERGSARWFDRSMALGWSERFLGRWAWAWGLALWLAVPVAFAWSWWSELPGAWIFPVAGAGTAAAATTVSLLYAERPR